jgi:2-polyprenyl-3-methyl-5-hydroxy-6-metoxy-1,4-benzoquinol methylase
MYEYDEIAASYIDAVSLPDIVALETSRIRYGVTLVAQRGTRATSVLDVGCAGARDLKTWMELGVSYYGVDYSVAMIEFALAQAARLGAANAQFRRGNLLAMELQPESVSLVWCSSVIQHVPRACVASVLTGFHAALESGGVLYLNVRPPKDGVPMEGIVTSKEYARSDGTKHVERFVSHYEMSEMEALLEGCGFSIESADRYREVYDQYDDGGEKASYLPEKFVVFARKV